MLKRDCTPYTTRLFQLPTFNSYFGCLGVLLQISPQIYLKLNLHLSNAKYVLRIRFVFPVITTFCISMKLCVVSTALESHIHKFHLHKAQAKKLCRENSSSVSWKSDLDKQSSKRFAQLLPKTLKESTCQWRKAILKYTCEFLSEDVRSRKNFKCKYDSFNQILIQNFENL